MSSRLLDLWSDKRKLPASLPGHAAFDALELRPWENNLCGITPELGSAGRIRFKIVEQGESLTSVLDGDMTGSLLPDPLDLEEAANPVLWSMIEVLGLAQQGKGARSKRRNGISPDGTMIRIDVMALPLSRDGNRPDRFLVLIYVEPAG